MQALGRTKQQGPTAMAHWGCSTIWPCRPAARRFASVKNVNKGKRKWADPAYQRSFLTKISAVLKVKEFADWYRVSRKEVSQRGGKGLLLEHGSLANALQRVFPEYAWEGRRFAEEGGRAPPGFWQNRANLLVSLTKAEKILNITKPEDWYSVTLSDLKKAGFTAKIGKLQLGQLLGEKYPHHKWEKVYLLRGKYAQQHRLEQAVSTLFTGEDIKYNSRKEAGLIHPDTKDYLELDIYIPSLRLAFEYQEKHHYMSSQFIYQPLSTLESRDNIKQTLAKEKGITLITVPFWWDGERDSLIATIREARPDLQAYFASSQTKEAKPIPADMPSGLLDKHSQEIVDIGQPISACFFSTANVDPSNWWMLEKYDGVRGFWNPHRKAFYSRLGRQFSLPSEIIEAMPNDIFLDGEIWFGRDSFQEAMKIANRVDAAQIDWKKMKYMVYDVPNHKGTYEARYALLQEKLGGEGRHPFTQIAPMVLCSDMSHLDNYFQNVVENGGEGIILRDPQSLLIPGRSPGFLKHKKFRDAEARVLGAVGPQQWECELPNGVTFTAAAGTTEFAKRWNPQPGDIISFKHHGYLLASQKPKFPTLYRLRSDITWDDVVHNWKEQKSTPNGLPLQRPSKKHAPKGHWLDLANSKQFFIEFAQERGFDPLSAEDWNTVTRREIYAKKGGMSILKNYNCSLVRALRSVFPEMKPHLRDEKTPKGYWQDPKNCRSFFDEYAEEKGFDPLDLANGWHTLHVNNFLVKTGARAIGEVHGGFRNALKVAYPELQLKTSWESHSHRDAIIAR